MPIFEYICGKCSERFELLVRGAGAPVCPACGHKKVEKQLSTFAAKSGRAPDPACGAESPCGGGRSCPSGGCPFGG